MHKRGFTLIEIVVVLAVLLVLTGVGVIAYTNILTSANIDICRSQRQEAINLYRIYVANGGDYDIDGSTDMEFLVEQLLLNEEYRCPDGGVYTWQVENDNKINITCSKHGELNKLNTPLGNNFDEITTKLKTIIEEYYEENGTYPRSWGEFAYSDIGLNSEDWDEPFEHVAYTPRGDSFSIRPEEGYKMVVMGADGKERVLKESYNWNLWYDFITGEWYYKSIFEENYIDIKTLEILAD